LYARSSKRNVGPSHWLFQTTAFATARTIDAIKNTTPLTTAITHLISTGTAEQVLLAVVVRAFPELTPAELSQALQVATTAAERNVLRPH
jgi:hypothetical protein